MQNDLVFSVNDRPHILIVEDDLLTGEAFRCLLEEEGFKTTHVANGLAAQVALQQSCPNVLLLDLLLPDMHGRELLKQIQQQRLPVTVVVVTGEARAESAVEAMHGGAFDYLVKPVDENRLVTTVRNAVERQLLHQQLDQYRTLQSQDQFESFIGRSLPMQTVYRMIENAAVSQASVFITGESGTGKELCADAIHRLSSRRNYPMVSINCAAIPRELLESEIFGHTKGAFTGATSERKGAAAAANGGTLFFDEICDMDLELQAKLLRFIQSKHYRRVGSDKDEVTDVRFICATNRNPLIEMHEGRFREDLYYRLHVIPIEMPALRIRGTDILLLAQYLLFKYADEEGKRFEGFSLEAEQILRDYPWPGNVRELQNLLHKVVIMNDGGVIEEVMLGLHPFKIRSTTASQQNGDGASLPGGGQAIEGETIQPLWKEEKAIIERAIERCDGNVVKAAERLGISDSTIYRKRSKWATLDH